MNKKGEIQVADLRALMAGTYQGPKIEDCPNNDDWSMRDNIFDKRNPGYSLNCSFCEEEVHMHAWGLMSRGARCSKCKALYWNGFWWRWKNPPVVNK